MLRYRLPAGGSLNMTFGFHSAECRCQVCCARLFGNTIQRCNCDQSLALAKRLDVALEALDAILSMVRDYDPTRDHATAELVVGRIGSIVALAGAALEKSK